MKQQFPDAARAGQGCQEKNRWLFEKINETDKPVDKLIRKRKRRNKLPTSGARAVNPTGSTNIECVQREYGETI